LAKVRAWRMLSDVVNQEQGALSGLDLQGLDLVSAVLHGSR
jgi:hypothetical protein